MLNDAHPFQCPWCGEINHVELDPGDAGQWLVQDCTVCCSPIEIRLPAAGGVPEVRRE
jgi:hypothetical protein